MHVDERSHEPYVHANSRARDRARTPYACLNFEMSIGSVERVQHGPRTVRRRLGHQLLRARGRQRRRRVDVDQERGQQQKGVGPGLNDVTLRSGQSFRVSLCMAMRGPINVLCVRLLADHGH